MNPITLKLLHYAGALGLFASLGSTLLANSGRKSAAMLHGICLILLLIVGFAMLQKPPLNQAWWMIKLGLWLFLAVAPTMAKRKVLPGSVVLLLSIGAGVFAAYLGNFKPF